MTLNSLTNEEDDPNPLPAEPPSLGLKWAALLHDIGKFDTYTDDGERIRYDKHAEVGAEISKNILKRLKFPKKIIDKVGWLIEHHMMIVPLFEMDDDRRRHWFLMPGFPELLEIHRADCMGIKPLNLTAYEKLKKLYRHEIAKLKLMPKQLVKGEDVMKILKIKPGEKVGEILKDIRNKQLGGELKTSKDAKNYIKKLHTTL
jgi:poly(A) polymerase